MNIIDGLQNKIVKKIEKLITTIGWLIMLGYVLQTVLSIIFWIFNLSNFYHKLFIFGNIEITVHTFLITFTIAICIFLLLYLWGRYNYKRYAHINRRTFPKDVTSDEIALYFGLKSSLVEKMQNDKIIILEKTIV
jgi:poly-beta-1,6-N-acetyl-D-glucosamine biosynthesis protein PgaD